MNVARTKVLALVAAGLLVVGCGSGEVSVPESTTVAAASTGLECAGERERFLEADLDPDTAGPVTEDAAAAATLSFYINQHGGEMVMLRQDAYGMEVGGRIVVVADVTHVPAGGFWVTTVHVCDSFVPIETGPPETVTPATTG